MCLNVSFFFFFLITYRLGTFQQFEGHPLRQGDGTAHQRHELEAAVGGQDLRHAAPVRDAGQVAEGTVGREGHHPRAHGEQRGRQERLGSGGGRRREQDGGGGQQPVIARQAAALRGHHPEEERPRPGHHSLPEPAQADGEPFHSRAAKPARRRRR